MQRIAVFCASSPGNRPAYREAAAALGAGIAARGMSLVYGGASVGLMGALADAALAGGAEVIGVIPRRLVDREVAHGGLTEQHVVETMHERKTHMISVADAFVALPGGYGTLDELFEVLTYAQIGLLEKPIVLLDVEDYYRPLLAALDHMHAEGLLRTPDRSRPQVVRDVDAALDLLAR